MPSPLSCSSPSRSNNKKGFKVCLGPNVEPHRAACIYFWIASLTVAIGCNLYLSCQLRVQSSEQQIQLEHLIYRVNSLASTVNQSDSEEVSTSTTDQRHQSTRVKRYSYPIHPPTKEKEKFRIERAFRWVEESNWTDLVGTERKARRQVAVHTESIPDIADDNKQPAVEFFPRPQPSDQQSSPGYEWLTSYCRISLSALEQYCFAAQKRCLRGNDGSDKKGDKGDPGPPGLPGPVGPPGIAGPPGMKGTAGLDGIDGVPGEPGLDGTPGIDGVPGLPGVSGQPGNDGTPGRNGIDGKPGQKGEPGIPGIPGMAGPTGPRGKRGSPGVDGKPGVQVLAWKHNSSSSLLIAPSIDDMSDKEQTITVKENESVRLICVASGQPKPLITWRRQDKRPIQLDTTSQNLVEGSHLNISRIPRDNMGQYLCVATNGVPPAASKRVNLLVTFPPLVKILQPKQMIGATKGSWVVLECYVEAYPEPFVQWIYGDTRILAESAKYNMSEEVLETRLHATFSRRALLNITLVESADFGLYKCEARNQRGRTFGIITLFETDVRTVTEQSSLMKEHSFVVYGEMPKLIESKAQCEPCPDCSHSYSNQCKEGKRENISNLGLPALLNLTSWKLTKRAGECYLSQIGKPVFYSDYGAGEIGCWMRDPKPVKPEDAEKYWLTRVENNQLLQEFNSKENFMNKVSTHNYTLVHRFTGNAQTIYSGVFYYAQEGSNRLVTFNLETLESAFLNLETGVNSPRASIGRKPPARHVRSHRVRRRRENEQHLVKRLYSNNLNKMDIAADENGIWLLYPNFYSEANNTIVMKLNGTSIECIWNLTIDYHKVGDTFLMCGVLYGIDSLTELNTHISFAYDLYQNKELKHLEQIEFTNPFMTTQYIGYNARYQKLYTWDNGNILEYQLKIESNNNKLPAKSDEKDEE